MSLKGDINFTSPDTWHAVMEDGNVVVLVHEPNRFVYDPTNHGILQRCRREIKLWHYKEVTKVEFETLGAICDLLEIDITEFIDWEKHYVDGNRECNTTSNDDFRRPPRKGFSGLYQRWRMFWLQVWIRPHRT